MTRPVPAFMRAAEAQAQSSTNIDDNVCSPSVRPVSRRDRPAATPGGSPENVLWELARWPAYDCTRANRLCGSGASGYERILEGIRPIVHAARAEIEGYIHASQIEATARSIAEFCSKDLVPGSGRTYVDPETAKRNREKREVSRRAVAVWKDKGFLGRGVKAYTIRQIAATEERSRSTVHRDLMTHGIQPRRDARIAELNLVGRNIVETLEMLVPHHGLSDKVWFSHLVARCYPSRFAARSTPAMRVARVKEAIKEINKAGIGLHIFVDRASDQVAFCRGKHVWKGMKELAAFFDEAPVRLIPELPKVHTDPVSEALQDFHAMVELLANRPSFRGVLRLGQLCAEGVAFDPRPIKLLASEMSSGYHHTPEWAACALLERFNAPQQGHRKNPVDLKPYQRFIRCADWLAFYGCNGKDVGAMLAEWMEDSGLQFTLESRCSRHARQRLNALLGMCAALKGCDHYDAFEKLAAWKKDRDSVPLSAPKTRGCSQESESSVTCQVIEYEDGSAHCWSDLSHLRYHVEKDPQPGGGERPPPERQSAA